jgi:hypothetical protein
MCQFVDIWSLTWSIVNGIVVTITPSTLAAIGYKYYVVCSYHQKYRLFIPVLIFQKGLSLMHRSFQWCISSTPKRKACLWSKLTIYLRVEARDGVVSPRASEKASKGQQQLKRLDQSIYDSVMLRMLYKIPRVRLVIRRFQLLSTLSMRIRDRERKQGTISLGYHPVFVVFL